MPNGVYRNNQDEDIWGTVEVNDKTVRVLITDGMLNDEELSISVYLGGESEYSYFMFIPQAMYTKVVDDGREQHFTTVIMQICQQITNP